MTRPRPFPFDPTALLPAIGAVWLFGPLVPELVRDWSEAGDFSHGWLVAPVAAWLLWIRRDRFFAAPARTWWPGALILGFGVLQYLLGAVASEYYLQRTAVVPYLLGWIGLVWGRERLGLALFPTAFLLFMVPPPALLWSKIALPLQLLASQGAYAVLAWSGLDVSRSGNVIQLPGLTLEVAHACSGLRSLVALLALGAILAEGSLLDGRPRRWLARGALFFGAIPVAVLANALRVAGTALAAAWVGPSAATGWAHETAGAAVFAVSFALLWWGRRWLVSREERPAA